MRGAVPGGSVGAGAWAAAGGRSTRPRATPGTRTQVWRGGRSDCALKWMHRLCGVVVCLWFVCKEYYTKGTSNFFDNLTFRNPCLSYLSKHCDMISFQIVYHYLAKSLLSSFLLH